MTKNTRIVSEVCDYEEEFNVKYFIDIQYIYLGANMDVYMASFLRIMF